MARPVGDIQGPRFPVQPHDPVAGSPVVQIRRLHACLIGIRDRKHRHVIAESVQKIAHVLRSAFQAIGAGYRGVPPPGINIGHGRHAQCIACIAPGIHTILDRTPEVLIPRKMESESLSDGPERRIPPVLRPAIGVHVLHDAIIGGIFAHIENFETGHHHIARGLLRQGRHIDENRLGHEKFHPRAVRPVCCPMLQKIELPLAQKVGSRSMQRLRRIRGLVLRPPVFNVEPGRQYNLRRIFPLAILDDPETDAPVHEIGVIDADTLFDGRRVVRRRKMRGLRPLHGVHPGRRHDIPARILPLLLRSAGPGGLAPGSPYVAVIHVMVIGNSDRGNIFRKLAVLPAEEIPLAQVIKHRGVERPFHIAVSAYTLVDVVPGEKQNVRVMPCDAPHQIGMGKPEVVVARETCHDNLFLIHRITAHRAFEDMPDRIPPCVCQVIGEAIGNIQRIGPIGNGKGRRTRHGIDRGSPDLFPSPFPAHR